MKYQLVIIVGMMILFNFHNGFSQALHKEVGIRIGGSGGYSFVYKKEQSENKYKRMRLNAGKIDFSKLNDVHT